MPAVTNLLLLLDTLTAVMATQQRISAILNKAASENRDVSQAELDTVATSNDDLAAQIKAGL